MLAATEKQSARLRHAPRPSGNASTSFPVHSFRTLLVDLGTLTANTMWVADGDATVTLLTEPTLEQQRSFELVGWTPRM